MNSVDFAGVAMVVLAYAVGALPWGFIFGRVFGKVDLRRVGSGGTGATNALRALGWRISLAVLALDFLKGLLPVVLARAVGLDNWWVVAAAIATVIGHCWSPFIGFRGGKGMATGAGAATGILPAVLLITPIMAAIVWATRYVSLASIVGSLAVAASVAALGATGHLPVTTVVAVAGIVSIILFQHQTNIQRLLAGKERRFGDSVRP